MLAKPKRISELRLKTHPGEAFEAVRRGDTVVVEKEGRSDVAMVDFVDLQILKAVIEHYLHRLRIDPQVGLPDTELEGLEGQALFDLVISRYLASAISLGRAASALGIPWVELRTRLTRLGLPVWTGPTDAEGIRQDALVAESVAT